MENKISIFKLRNTFVFKKPDDSKFFSTTATSFVIPTFNFSTIIKFMVFRGLLSPKVLEGILEEFYNADK